MCFSQACSKISKLKSTPTLAQIGNCFSLLCFGCAAMWVPWLIVPVTCSSVIRVPLHLKKKKKKTEHPLPLNLTKWAFYEQLWRPAIRTFISLPADVLWGSFVTHSFHECWLTNPKGRLRGGYTFISKMLYYIHVHFTTMVMTPPLWIKSLICTGFSIFNLVFGTC